MGDSRDAGDRGPRRAGGRNLVAPLLEAVADAVIRSSARIPHHLPKQFHERGGRGHLTGRPPDRRQRVVQFRRHLGRFARWLTTSTTSGRGEGRPSILVPGQLDDRVLPGWGDCDDEGHRRAADIDRTSRSGHEWWKLEPGRPHSLCGRRQTLPGPSVGRQHACRSPAPWRHR